jgi:hypothetical protein
MNSNEAKHTNEELRQLQRVNELIIERDALRSERDRLRAACKAAYDALAKDPHWEISTLRTETLRDALKETTP